MARNDIAELNGTFSGADIVVNIIFPGCTPICIGNLSTLTYSTYREKKPVRTIGRINAKGFAHGQRTIAGTLIFTVLHKHVVNIFKSDVPYLKNIKKLKPCELPPFDLLMTYGNEYGASAHMALYGVTIVDEGKIMSIEDMFTENTWSYMARDIDLMNDIGSEMNSPIATLGEFDSGAKFASNDLVLDDDYVKMKEAMEQMKIDQEALIAELRNNSNLYIGQPGGWVPGQDIIVVPPTGTSTLLPGNGDIDITEENHPEIKIEVADEHPTGVPKEDIWIYVNLEIDTGIAITSDVYKFQDLDVKLKAKLECGCATMESEFKITDKKMTIKFINFQGHTPTTPTIYVGVSKAEFSTGGRDYVLSSDTMVKIENPSSHSKSNPIKFQWNKKGSSKQEEADKDYVFKLKFTPNSYTSLGSLDTPANKMTQYIFRDATHGSLKGDPPSSAVGNAMQPDYYTTTTVTYDNSLMGLCCDVSKMDPKKILGSFTVKGEVTQNGKTVTPKNHKKMKVKCNYRCTFTLPNGEKVVIDGTNSNNNMTKIYQDVMAPVNESLKNGGSIGLDEVLAGTSLEPVKGWNNNSFQIVSYKHPSSGLADQVVALTHVAHDCEDCGEYEFDPRVPYKPHSTKAGKDKCLCGMTHNKLTFELYNFRMYDPTTNKETPNTGDVKSVFFRVINMTQEVYNFLT